MANQNHDHDHEGFAHPVSVKLLLAVFVALVSLTILTVVVNGFPLGKWDLFVALGIATIKGSLVCLFFMHMYWEKGLNIVAFLSSIFFVAMFIGMALMDTSAYRDSIDSFPKTDRPDPPIVRTQ